MWVAPLILMPAVWSLEVSTEISLAAAALFDRAQCVACHDAGEDSARFPLFPASNLDQIGSRVRPAWLESYLLQDHEPSLLATLPAEERPSAVLDLVHYLASRGGPLPEAGTATPLREIEAGRRLYHRIGCVACHDPFDLPDDLDVPIWNFEGGWIDGENPIVKTELSLADLAEKTSRVALASYLLDPVSMRPDGRMPSLGLTELEARRIASYLTSADILDGSVSFEFQPGLAFREIHGELDDELRTYLETPAFRLGVVPDLTTLPDHPEDYFGFLFEGFIDIPHDGSWTFFSESDDGSRVYVDGALVVDNAGLHGPTELEGTLDLSAGKHSLAVSFFEWSGGEAFKVSWSGPGVEKAQMPASALSHLAAAEKASAPSPFVPDAARVAAGAQRYAKLGCVQCHDPTADAPRPARALADLNLSALDSCLALDSEMRSKGEGTLRAPQFTWTPDERASLVEFLRDIPPEVPDPAFELERTLLRLNCYACHDRGARGGPVGRVTHEQVDEQAVVRAAYFRAESHVDLGDEGRLPPHLDGVGAKLLPAWLAKVLGEGAPVRPYLATRMPRFGTQNVGRLSALFRDVDAPPEPSSPPPFSEEAVENGRRLASVGSLGCIQCHDLGQHSSLGIPAVNLTTAHERIEPAWFRELLLDPQSLGMNSRMPIFWQEGMSPTRDILDGDPGRQTDALWTWLSLGEAMPLPDGLVVPDEEYELIPRERPILCAVFLKGVSPRALLVGFPERVHYAFDLAGSRPALAWRGRFYNARGTWHARAGGLEVPPSADAFRFVGGVPLARLGNEDAAWPIQDSSELGYQFLGRRLDADGIPTFRSSIDGNVIVEETLRPRIVDADARLIRRLRITGPALEDYALRIAAGDDVGMRVDGRWSVDGVVFAASLPEGARLAVRSSAGRNELLIHLPDASVVEVEVEISW